MMILSYTDTHTKENLEGYLFQNVNKLIEKGDNGILWLRVWIWFLLSFLKTLASQEIHSSLLCSEKLKYKIAMWMILKFTIKTLKMRKYHVFEYRWLKNTHLEMHIFFLKTFL